MCAPFAFVRVYTHSARTQLHIAAHSSHCACGRLIPIRCDVMFIFKLMSCLVRFRRDNVIEIAIDSENARCIAYCVTGDNAYWARSTLSRWKTRMSPKYYLNAHFCLRCVVCPFVAVQNSTNRKPICQIDQMWSGWWFFQFVGIFFSGSDLFIYLRRNCN